jgi:hypothetical protein
VWFSTSVNTIVRTADIGASAEAAAQESVGEDHGCAGAAGILEVELLAVDLGVGHGRHLGKMTRSRAQTVWSRNAAAIQAARA